MTTFNLIFLVFGDSFAGSTELVDLLIASSCDKSIDSFGNVAISLFEVLIGSFEDELIGIFEDEFVGSFEDEFVGSF